MVAIELNEEMWRRVAALAAEVGSTPGDILAAAIKRYDEALRAHLDSG